MDNKARRDPSNLIKAKHQWYLSADLKLLQGTLRVPRSLSGHLWGQNPFSCNTKTWSFLFRSGSLITFWTSHCQWSLKARWLIGFWCQRTAMCFRKCYCTLHICAQLSSHTAYPHDALQQTECKSDIRIRHHLLIQTLKDVQVYKTMLPFLPIFCLRQAISHNSILFM